jgi:outer membrane protein assembly factor BamB
MEATEPTPAVRTTRWWPLVLIAAAAAIAILWFQAAEEFDRQSANIRSMLAGVGAALLVLIWLLGFSRLPARKRLLSGLGYIGVFVLFFVGFRTDGVSGNLVPIFVWRWSEAKVFEVPDVVRAIDGEPVADLSDFPQFFGPSRTGNLSGSSPKLARDWSGHPPEVLWRREVGKAWSGFVVAGRRAITQEQHGEYEAVVCYEILSGEVLWVHKVRARYDEPVAGVGPRATPTIDGERLFVVGSTGMLECLELATGKAVWTKNFVADNGGKIPEWGVACSPLVLETVVVVGAGGPKGRSLVAYDKKTGDVAWSGGDAAMHWSSPVRALLVGRPQILIFHAGGVAGHDAGSGEVLWTHPWPSEHPHVAMPVVCPGDRVCISSGYGTGCQLVQIAKKPDGTFAATEIWRTRRLKAKFANFLEHDSHIYGLDDGILTCVEVATGKRSWKRGRYGHGQILLVDDILLVTSETGRVALVAATPEEYRELTRFVVFEGKTWNPPALAGRYLLVRNAREAACLKLPVRE